MGAQADPRDVIALVRQTWLPSCDSPACGARVDTIVHVSSGFGNHYDWGCALHYGAGGYGAQAVRTGRAWHVSDGILWEMERYFPDEPTGDIVFVDAERLGDLWIEQYVAHASMRGLCRVPVDKAQRLYREVIALWQTPPFKRELGMKYFTPPDEVWKRVLATPALPVIDAWRQAAQETAALNAEWSRRDAAGEL